MSRNRSGPVGAGACGSSLCGIDTEWRKCTAGNGEKEIRRHWRACETEAIRSDSVIWQQNGQNMTGEVAGTIEGMLPEEAHDAQAQDQTQIPVEDTQLPDWLASQLDEGAAEDSTAVKATGKDGTYRNTFCRYW